MPQAVCSRYGLAVGAYSAWFVQLLMIVCWPVAFPISKVLDAVLGHEETVRDAGLLPFGDLREAASLPWPVCSHFPLVECCAATAKTHWRLEIAVAALWR